MYCDCKDVMETQEQYVRGWIRLFATASSDETLAEMGQYALDITKLKHAHMKRCPLCLENEYGTVAQA